MSIRGEDEDVYRYREECEDEWKDAREEMEKPGHPAPGLEEDAPKARAREDVDQYCE